MTNHERQPTYGEVFNAFTDALRPVFGFIPLTVRAEIAREAMLQVEAFRSGTTPQPRRHDVDTCGWDFDALADLVRQLDHGATRPAADALRTWFDDHGLDVDQLGGG